MNPELEIEFTLDRLPEPQTYIASFQEGLCIVMFPFPRAGQVRASDVPAPVHGGVCSPLTWKCFSSTCWEQNHASTGRKHRSHCLALPSVCVTGHLHRSSTRAGSGRASWNFSPPVWRDYFYQHDSWQQCPADLKRLSLHWLEPLRTEGSSLLKSLSKKMETQSAVSKPQNSNNHWPRAWTKEQGKISNFCLRGLNEIFLKDRRFSLISTQCGAEKTIFSWDIHGALQEGRSDVKKGVKLGIWGLRWDPYGGRVQSRDTLEFWHTCSYSSTTDCLRLAWHTPPARKEPEGMWLHEGDVRHGWQQQTQKQKCCSAMETMEGLQLERQYSVRAPWAHTYFTEGKMGNVQYNISASSIPSASQTQARSHHMVIGNYTGRVLRSWNTVMFPQSLGMGCALPITVPN